MATYEELKSQIRRNNYNARSKKINKSYDDLKRDVADYRTFGPVQPTVTTPAPTVTATPTPTIRTDRWYANQFANKTAANAAQYADRKSKAEMRSGGATAEQYRDNMQRNNTAQFDAGKNEIRSSRVNTLSPTKAGKIVEIAGTKAVEAQMASARRKENQAQANYQQWNDLDNNAKKLVDIAYGGDINNSLDTRIAAENELKTKYNMTNKDLKNVRKGRKEERSRGQSLLEDKRLSKMYDDLGPEGRTLLRTYGSKGVQLLGGEMLRAESLRAENELRTKYRLSDDDITQLSVYAEQYDNANKFKTAETVNKYAQESAAAHPIRTSAATLVTNLIGSVMSKGGQAYEAVNLARLRGSGYNEPVSIDKNNPLFAATRYTNKARETVAEQQFDTKLGSFLYQTGMSLADSAIAAGISKMFPAGSVVPLALGERMLGMSAGASTMLDLADKGATAEMSLLGGLASEVFETAFEHISISQLDTFSKVEAAEFTKGVSKQVIKDNLKLYAKKLGATTFTNATEEGFTEIANLIYDTIANGGYSQYAEYFNDARKNGATEAQAKTLAVKNMALQVLEAAAGGALMGGVFGVGGGVNLALNYNSFNKGATRLGGMVDATGQRADVVNTAEALPEGSESQRLLNKFTNSKKGLTENRLGRLAIENETYLQNADTDMLKQVEAKRTEIAETKGQNARENFDYYELTNSVVGTDKSGKEIRMVNANVGDTSKGAKIFSKNKNGALTFKTSDGKTMELNKRTVEQIQNPETKALAKSALVYGLGADGTNLLFDTYNPETLTSDHTAAFVRVYRQGALGTQSKALFGTYGEDMDRFTADQQRDILKAGLAEKQTKPGATDWRVAEKNNKFVSLQVKAMNAVAKALSKNGEQKEIFVVDDLYEEYTAKDANGNDVKSYRYLNGQYLTDSGKIIISARADKGLLLSFLGHEMGHEMKVNDINAFNNLAELVESHYGKEEYDKQIQKFTEQGYSEEDAKEELICNSLFDVFDKDTIKKVFGRDKAAVVKLYRVLETISNAYNSAMSEYANSQDYKGNLKHADIQKLNNDRELLDGVKEIFTDYLSRMQAGEYKDVKGGAAKNSISDRNRAAENFNELYTLDKDGILKPKNIDDLSTEDWEIIYKTTKRLGYDIRSAADAKQVFGRYVGKYGFNEDQSAAIAKAYGAVNAEETEPASRENPARMLQAEKHYGTTTNFAEAGYLLRDGKMLDFSGYKFGGSRNMRSMDHREIHAVFDTSDSEPYDSNSRYMNAFISEGQIRLMDGQGVTIGELEPTEKQYSLLNKFIERTLKSDDYFAVDIINQNGINIENREYDGDVSPRKIIDDIKYYYKNGEMPYRSELSGFYAKDSVSDRNEQEMVNRLGKNAEVQTDDKGNLVLATDKDHKTAMYSYSTWQNGGRDALADLLRKAGHTQEEINDSIEMIEDAADYLQILAAGYAKNQGYTDLANHLIADVTTDVAHGKQILSAMVSNGDYPVNFDVGLVCKKRVAYMKLLTRLVKDGVLGNVNFNGSAIAEVNQVLRDNGFETACLGCFVESRRLQIQTWAEVVTQEWNEAVDKVRKNAPYFNFAQEGKESAGNLTQDEIDALDNWIQKQELNDKGNVATKQRTPIKRVEKLLEMVAKSGDKKAFNAIAKKITVGDIITTNGLTELRSVSGDLFSFVKSRYGTNTPKIVQDFNPYNSEIAMLTFQYAKALTGESINGRQEYIASAKQTLADSKPPAKDKEATAKWDEDVQNLAMQNYLKDIGGARIQSFSDFMIENVFDYLQIVADLDARGFTMHGYTKEINCLRLFGMTGIKWNGSFIAHVDPRMGKEYAGLMPASEAKAHRGFPVTVDGKEYSICLDDYERHNKYDKNSFIQSIGYKDMIALQCDKRYSPYVGSICIGVSDKQIRAMLASPLVRMVIPYHSSGMNPEFAELVGVDYYTDYTDYQNTRIAKLFDVNGKEVDKLPKDKINPDKYLFNATFQELGDAKAAASAYVEWCAEKHPVTNDKGKIIGYATYEPKFSQFVNEDNYYKLLEDFNSYDSVTETSAVQDAVKMNLPSEDNRLSAAELEEYKQRLRDTGLFSEKEIEKYAKKAQQTFKEIINDAVNERAIYNSTVMPKFDGVVKQVEDILLKKYNRDDRQVVSVADYLKKKDQKKAKGWYKPLAGTYAKNSVSDREYAPTFYSQMGKVVEGIKQDKLSANGLINMLKGKGVKDEEIQWSGIEEWLADKGKSVTKQELQDFIKNSMLNIETVTLDERATFKVNREGDETFTVIAPDGERLGFYYDEEAGTFLSPDSDLDFDTPEDAEMYFNDPYVQMDNDIDVRFKTKWHEYKTVGGSNYRELLFTVPGSDYSNQAMSVHWGRPGVLAHARIQDMPDADGNKMLFIDEIQSDWHNAAEKKENGVAVGYKRKGERNRNTIAEETHALFQSFKNEKAIKELTKRISKAYANSVGYDGEDSNTLILDRLMDWDSTDYTVDMLRNKGVSISDSDIDTIKSYANKRSELYDEWQSAPRERSSVPDAPFKNGKYVDYVLKNLLRMAAENGYDKLAWTPSEMQSERWSDEYAEGYRIEYDQDMPKFLNKFGKKFGAKVGVSYINPLDEYARKVKQNTIDATMEYLPAIAEMYGEDSREYQNGLEGIENLKREMQGTPVWSIDITPEMKESVLYEGQPMYSRSDRGDVAEYEAEQFLDTATDDEIRDIVDEVDRRLQNVPYFEDKQEQTEVYAILDKMREKRDRLYEALSMDTGNESLTEYNRNTRNEMFGEAEPEGTIEGNRIINKGQHQNIKKADAEKLIKRYKNVHHDRGTPLSLENLDEATAKLQQFYEDMQNNPNMAWDDVFEKAKDVAVEIVKYTKYHKEIHHPGKVYQTTETVRYNNIFGDYIDTLGRHNRRSGEFVLTASDEILAPIINDIVTDYFDVPISNSDAVKTANLKTTYKNQIQALKNQLKQVRSQARNDTRQAVKAQREKDVAYYNQRMKEIRADRDQKLLAQRLAYQKSQQNRRENNTQRELKGKILRRYQRLDQELRKPNANRYVPADLVNTVAGVLGSLTDTLQTEETYKNGREIKSHIQRNKTLADLKVTYDAMQTSGEYSNYFDPTISALMQEVAENTAGKTINEMDSTELQQVYTLVSALDHTVRNAAKLEIAGKERDAFKIADRNIDQLQQVKKKKINGFAKYWYDQMNARTFFRQLSGYTEGGWMDVYDLLNEGQLKQSAIKAEVTEAFRELTSDKQARDLMDTKKLVDIGLRDADGNAIPVTRGIMLGIYMDLLNEDNTNHIAKGGLTVPDLEKYYKNDKEAYGNNTAYTTSAAGELRQINREINALEMRDDSANYADRIAELEARRDEVIQDADYLMDNIRTKIEQQLTDYERAWIEKAQWFFDEYSKSKLNEATMRMYGFKKANVNHYFPIRVDKTSVTPSFGELVQDMTLEGSGFMKDRQKGASNPIYAEDIVDVIKRQMDNVAAYAGLAPAIKDFNKIYGKSKTTEQGESIAVTSVQKAVKDVFGQYGLKYISDLGKDLQGARKGEPSILSTLRGNAYQAALTLNLRVAMAQAGSYPTAAAEIGWKPLIKALKRGGEKNSILSKADRELIAKYTPLLAIRVNGGNSTVDINNLKTLSAHSAQGVNARILQKTAAATDWISKVDAATVGRLWYAAQYYVDDNNPKLQKGTDEYYKEVAKVFNRIVERTQPSYTTMQRSALLRNPNEAQKFFTMYMTQRSQNYNLLYDSAMELNAMRQGVKNGTATQEQLASAKENFGRTISSQLAAGLTLSAMKIVADAIQHNMKGYRDDDDDEVKASKVLEKLGETWLESEISNVFLGSEIYSLVSSMITGETYYGISVNVTGALTDFTKDLKNMVSNPSPKSVDRAFRDAATILGIPSSQMQKFAKMGIYWYQDIVDGGGIWSVYEGDESNKQIAGKMITAYQNGNAKRYQAASDALDTKSLDSKQSAIRSYLKPKVLSGEISRNEAINIMTRFYGYKSGPTASQSPRAKATKAVDGWIEGANE